MTVTKMAKLVIVRVLMLLRCMPTLLLIQIAGRPSLAFSMPIVASGGAHGLVAYNNVQQTAPGHSTLLSSERAFVTGGRQLQQHEAIHQISMNDNAMITQPLPVTVSAAATGRSSARYTMQVSSASKDSLTNHASSLMKTTIVMLTYFKDVARALISISSLRKHMPSWAVHELILVVPYAESLVLPKILSNTSASWPVRILSDNDTLGVSLAQLGRVQKINNYRLQMLLKLMVARHVTTDFYLVMDSDVLMVRPLEDIQWLYPEAGKAVYQPQDRKVHNRWWRQSEEDLDLGGCLPKDDNTSTFGVTPAMLSTYIAKMAATHMVNRFGPEPEQWLTGLLPGPFHWTEYCAYRLMACKLGVFEQYHALRLPGNPGLYHGYWRKDQWQSAGFIKPCTDCLFLVLQSKSSIPERKVVEDLQMLFQ